ncbi:Fc receptor-like protein 5 [Collichthys lucidus]|uniref:Fc receptor-like protein 5 n=1 Tax=Collichthys lucidus TaxID=240159 RepID=A0A4U5VWZ6_COLLU|nr:Fc receptor-like protein 5 [Collichthys lucidus]
MDVTALCIRLYEQLSSFVFTVMDVLVLLVARVDHSCFAHKADAAFPRISPDRLQFFEYESVTVSCEEFSSLTEWRVMTKVNKTISPSCDSSPSCTIEPTFERHSGEYWCEDAEGQTSGVLNISVTAGSVILDFPARPVIEGSDVILHCRKEESQSKHIADFYKDDSHLMTSYENNIIIQNVSKSDEGLYKCRISGAGESPESRLTVLTQSKSAYEEPPSHSVSSNLFSLLWIFGLVALLLWIMGQLHDSKHRVCIFKSEQLTVKPPDLSVPTSETGYKKTVINYVVNKQHDAQHIDLSLCKWTV